MGGGNPPPSLPSGYKRVEYLESTGTQWINTLCYLSIDSVVDVDFMRTTTEAKDYILFGLQAPPNRYCVNTYYFNGYFLRFGNYVSNRLFNGVNVVNVKKHITIQNTLATLDDLQTNFAEQQPINQGYCYLFCGNANNTPIYIGIYRIYSFKIKEGDVEKLNLIPCLDNNSRPCMYDTVSQQTLYNSGTGEFLYGCVQ